MDQHTGQQVVARIGFAERWLARAKHQVAGGHLTRGALTLVLADAEVHRALEVAGLPRRTAFRPSAALAPLALGLVLLLAAAAIAVHRPAPPAAAAAGGPILRLEHRIGELLALVQVPAPAASPVADGAVAVEPAEADPAATRGQAPRPRAAAPARPAPAPAAAPPAAPAAVPLPAQAPAAPAAGTPPAPLFVILTAGDLIDLVLAAERTLRSDSAHR